MKKLIIAANWKSNMTKEEAEIWLREFSTQDFSGLPEVILLAPFTLLDMASAYIKEKDLDIALGAQDISPFEKGAYTGEIYSGEIKEFCSYVLIGHSERRSNFNETDEIVNKKIEEAASSGLNIIVCVSNISQVRSLTTDNLVIAYEPLDAIGTGNAENPEDVESFVNQIKEIKNSVVIYGGSVNSEIVKNYTGLENINGVLIGSESLKANSFSDIIRNAI
jgi:triosephosphate isomerase